MVGKHQYPRVLELPSGSFFLFGARGTGKSTWLRERFPGTPIFDLLEEATYQRYLRDPGAFASELRAVGESAWVIVDEIQRLPSLLNEVHRHIESRGLRFALCGSSARKLKQAGTNLLAGRAVRRFLHPFVPEELGADFDLDRILRQGSLPVVWSSPSPEEALEGYAQLYLKEEIQAEALVRNLPSFARFLGIAALFHGQVLNTTSLARDAEVARTTVEDYLSILEDTLVAFRLPAFTPRLRVRERTRPKLYWVDPGFPRALRQRTGSVQPEEVGSLFEGWLATLLRSYRDYRGTFDHWAYWASGTSTRSEVDFVLQKGDAFVAVEAKAGVRVRPEELKGVRALAELPGLARRIVVFRGERAQRTDDDIEILPVATFLAELEAGRLFEQAG
ncbi:MAG: ATP-binding protein [Planctomycetes bacterium]|nr:ATP-binding protein [Planctomycetota bacterium]